MRKKSPVTLAMCVSLMAIGMMVACQSVSGNSAPPALTVTPSSASVPLGGTKQFSASQAVTWSVSGSGLLGTIDGSGLYTAPNSGSTPAYPVITAISQTDTTKSATAQVTIPAVGVSVSPTPVGLYPNASSNWPTQAQQFAAVVSNAGNTLVSWTVSMGGGTVDGNGIYRAPASVPNPSAVTVTATSQADSAKSGTATVNVLTPTTLGTFTVTVTATEGSVSRSQAVTVTVQ